MLMTNAVVLRICNTKWGVGERNGKEQGFRRHTVIKRYMPPGKEFAVYSTGGFPRWNSGRESACQCRRCKRYRLNPWVRKIPGVGNSNPLQDSCLEHSIVKPGGLQFLRSQRVGHGTPTTGNTKQGRVIPRNRLGNSHHHFSQEWNAMCPCPSYLSPQEHLWQYLEAAFERSSAGTSFFDRTFL